jgi:hypothetical protein
MSGWGTGWGGFEHSDVIRQKALEEANIIDEAGPVTEEMWNTIPKFLNNKPTHDPYANPDAHIYYECGCGAILDPGTKSFAQLNNCASNAGWKVRWGADSYIPYCVKCGEDVE